MDKRDIPEDQTSANNEEDDCQPSTSQGTRKSTPAPHPKEDLPTDVKAAKEDSNVLPTEKRLELFGPSKQRILKKCLQICLQNKKATPEHIFKLLRNLRSIETLMKNTKSELRRIDEKMKSEETNTKNVADEEEKVEKDQSQKKRVSFSNLDKFLEFRSNESVSELLHPPARIRIRHSEREAKPETSTNDINDDFVPGTPGDLFKMYMKSLNVDSIETQDPKMFFKYGCEGQDDVKVSLCRLGVLPPIDEDPVTQCDETADTHADPHLMCDPKMSDTYTCPRSIQVPKKAANLAKPRHGEVLLMSGGFSHKDLFPIPSTREDETFRNGTFQKPNELSLRDTSELPLRPATVAKPKRGAIPKSLKYAICTGSKARIPTGLLNPVGVYPRNGDEKKELLAEIKIYERTNEISLVSVTKRAEAEQKEVNEEFRADEHLAKLCPLPKVVDIESGSKPNDICKATSSCSEKKLVDVMNHFEGRNQLLEEYKMSEIKQEDNEVLPSKEKSVVDNKPFEGRNQLLEEHEELGTQQEEYIAVSRTEKESVGMMKHFEGRNLLLEDHKVLGIKQEDKEVSRMENDVLPKTKAYVKYPTSLCMMPLRCLDGEGKFFERPNELLEDFPALDVEQNTSQVVEAKSATQSMDDQACTSQVDVGKLPVDMKPVAGQVESRWQSPTLSQGETSEPMDGGGDGQLQSPRALTDAEKETLLWYFMQVIEVFEKTKRDPDCKPKKP